MAGGSSSTLVLILVCLLKRMVGFSQAPVVRFCVRLDSFGITGLHVETQDF